MQGNECYSMKPNKKKVELTFVFSSFLMRNIRLHFDHDRKRIFSG